MREILGILIILQVGTVKSTPCQAATFIAKDEWKYLTSPYFPDTIHAKLGLENYIILDLFFEKRIFFLNFPKFLIFREFY